MKLPGTVVDLMWIVAMTVSIQLTKRMGALGVPSKLSSFIDIENRETIVKRKFYSEWAMRSF